MFYIYCICMYYILYMYIYYTLCKDARCMQGVGEGVQW